MVGVYDMSSSPSSVALVTICLNEMQWLYKLYEQHKNWPGLVKWVFVESADVTYAKTNPDMVTNGGLSVDGTSEFLKELARSLDDRITYIPYGFCGVNSPYPLDQAKCEARNRYLDVLEDYKPELMIQLDADEFYSYQDQKTISNILKTSSHNHKYPRHNFNGSAFCFKQRHIWFPPYLQTAQAKRQYPEYQLFSHEVIGGYWEVIHCRVWKWEPGLRYKKRHDWPEDTIGQFLVHKNEMMLRTDSSIPISLRNIHDHIPECIHMGYASWTMNRLAKHQYYQDRGEGKEDIRLLKKKRMMYVECRNEYKVWEPNGQLPHGAKVIPYLGKVPEVFVTEGQNAKNK